MIQFLTTAGTLASLQRIIDQAERHIVLISPYVQLSQDIQQRLASAATRSVPTAFVYGKQRKLKAEQVQALASIPGLALGFYQDLHAKCYLSDAGLILTSMNLYQASQNNREMGVFVTPEEPLYREAYREAEQIVQHAQPAALPPSLPPGMQALFAQISGGVTASAAREPRAPYRTRPGKARQRAVQAGHCIRCGGAVKLNPNVPHCKRCYRLWKHYENGDYVENYCHDCGQEHETSANRPLCRPCFMDEPNAFQRAARL